MRAFILPLSIALGLSVVLSVVYLRSFPRAIYLESASGDSVAGKLGLRPYLQSDGAFIVRQFRLGGTFTHNDHVLYHVAARRIHQTLLSHDEILAHLVLSVLAGGAGIGVLVFAGYQLSLRILPSVLAALLVAGSAGYWFFAASIDTYLPALFFSILALWVALLCVKTQQLRYYAVLGVVAGTAFLWRTDGVLLAPLVLAALGAPRDRLRRILVSGLAAALCGGIGYALLANHEYGVPLGEIWHWATGSVHRAPARSGVWGSVENLAIGPLSITVTNHLIYALIFPSLVLTRVPEVITTMSSSPSGLTVFFSYLMFAAVALVQVARRAAGPDGSRIRLLVLLGVSSLVARISFFTWWDPHDPFLFAPGSLPFVWLFAILPFTVDSSQLPRIPSAFVDRVLLTLLSVLVPLVWWHNFQTLILAVRRMGAPV